MLEETIVVLLDLDGTAAAENPSDTRSSIPGGNTDTDQSGWLLADKSSSFERSRTYMRSTLGLGRGGVSMHQGLAPEGGGFDALGPSTERDNCTVSKRGVQGCDRFVK